MQDFRKGAVIYGPTKHSTVYRIVDGKVRLYRVRRDASRALIDIYGKNEYVGESALMGGVEGEMAIAHERCSLIPFTVQEVGSNGLALRLMEVAIERCSELADRVTGFSLDKVDKRITTALVHFGEEFGVKADGCIEMPSMTHELLADYVGSTREIATAHLNSLRRKGLIQYDRKSIRLMGEIRKAA